MSGACVAAHPSLDRPPSLNLSPPPLSLGIVRGFIGTMQPSDSSCLPAELRSVELPRQARNRHHGYGQHEASQVPYKGRLHVHGVSDCARLLVRKPVARGGYCFPANRTASAPRNSTRFAAQYPARGHPCERFAAGLATRASRITRGRGGWLGLTPWKTCTSYPLPASLAHSDQGHDRPSASRPSTATHRNRT